MFKNKITTIEELRTLYAQPGKVSLQKQRPSFDQNSRAFISSSPFVLLSTSDSNGRCDVSPKGDKPGFVKVLDEKHLIIPDRPGNNRLDSLTNLIENAVKYGKRARVALAASPQTIEIAVEDDGPGIPADQLAKVFEPFYRVEESRNRDTGGVGLGLAIARTVVEAQGGTLTLANRTPAGLCALIVLPRHPK